MPVIEEDKEPEHDSDEKQSSVAEEESESSEQVPVSQPASRRRGK